MTPGQILIHALSINGFVHYGDLAESFQYPGGTTENHCVYCYIR